MSLLIGLTGGIGSGKSTVARILADQGACVIDADAISRQITAAGGAAISAIQAQFGIEFVDDIGALNRSRMRELVFSESTAKAKLESIVHPFIQQEMQAQIDAARAQAVSLIVLDLPLLAERNGFSGWKPKLNAVWVIDCAQTTQIERVKVRSGLDESQIQAVMRNQASRQDRLAIADLVITNENINLDRLREVIISALQVSVYAIRNQP